MVRGGGILFSHIPLDYLLYILNHPRNILLQIYHQLFSKLSKGLVFLHLVNLTHSNSAPRAFHFSRCNSQTLVGTALYYELSFFFTPYIWYLSFLWTLVCLMDMLKYLAKSNALFETIKRLWMAGSCSINVEPLVLFHENTSEIYNVQMLIFLKKIELMCWYGHLDTVLVCTGESWVQI